MNRLTLSFLVLALLLSFTGCQEPVKDEQAEPIPSAIGATEPLKNSLKSCIESINKGTLDKLIPLLSEEVQVMPPGSAPITGKAEVEAWLKEQFERYRFQLSYSSGDWKIAEGWAFGSGKLACVLYPSDGSSQQVISGKSLHIFRQQPDGTWQLSRIIWNSDIPSMEEVQGATR